LTAVHEVPLFVERYSPPCTPAKISFPLTAKALIHPPPGPFVCSHWPLAEPVKNEQDKKNIKIGLFMQFIIGSILLIFHL
jgi:hypothetical protein